MPVTNLISFTTLVRLIMLTMLASGVKPRLRVHICPVGFEVLRVAEPLLKMSADKAYLITHRRDDPAHQCVSRIKEVLRKRNSRVEIVEAYVDIWNLVDCVSKFKEIIQTEAGNSVYINVSTGTKVTAIAGTTVSMLTESIPYYAKVDHTRQRSVIPANEKVEEAFPIPVYSMVSPKHDALKLLKFVDEAGGSIRKKDLIERLSEVEVIKPVAKGELSLPAAHSQLRALLDPLEREWHFVRIESKGRSSKVILTEPGKVGLRIFS